jgi:Flp pilus assembly protein TadD
MGEPDVSLVNEMLRNLDRRDARPSTELLGALPSWSGEPIRRRPSLLLRAGAGATVVAALLAIALPWRSETPARVETPAAPAVMAALPRPDVALPLPDAALAPIAPPPKVRILDLALTEGADDTRLSLELSRATAHRLERSADRRVVELTFEDAELGADLPHLELRGTPIETFESERVDGALRIRLRTSRPVRVHSVIRGSDSEPRLELRLLAESTGPAPRHETATRTVPTGRTRAPGRAIELWREALQRSERGDESGSESALREALVLAPEEFGVRSSLVALLLRTGRVDAAEEEIEAGRAQTGDLSGYAALSARALLARGDTNGALLELERDPPALARSPDHHALLAAVLERVGRHASAAETYRSLLLLDVKRPDWWLGLALAREGEGRSAEALAAYRSASRLPGLGSDASRWVDERVLALSRGN